MKYIKLVLILIFCGAVWLGGGIVFSLLLHHFLPEMTKNESAMNLAILDFCVGITFLTISLLALNKLWK